LNIWIQLINIKDLISLRCLLIILTCVLACLRMRLQLLEFSRMMTCFLDGLLIVIWVFFLESVVEGLLLKAKEYISRIFFLGVIEMLLEL